MNRTILFLSFMMSLPLLQAQPAVAPSPDHAGAEGKGSERKRGKPLR